MIGWLLTRGLMLYERVQNAMLHRAARRSLQNLQRRGETERWHWFYDILSWSESARTTIADVLLLPDQPSYKGEAMRITIEAMLAPGFADHMDEHHGLKEMRDAAYHMDFAHFHLIVRATDFDEPEMVRWIGRWLDDNGLGYPQLRRGPNDMFGSRPE